MFYSAPRLDLPLDGQVEVVDDCPVWEVVLAVEGQAKVGAKKKCKIDISRYI